MTWLWLSASAVYAHVPPGRVAFVNGGTEPMFWGRVCSAEQGVDRRVVAEFVASASAAAAAARAAIRHSVAVLGDGLLAQLTRAALPAPSAEPSDVVVDTTGSPHRIQRAVASLPRLGHLLLAAPLLDADVALATYTDIHVRGLTVHGLPWVDNPTAGAYDAATVDRILDELPRASMRSPLFAVSCAEMPWRP